MHRDQTPPSLAEYGLLVVRIGLTSFGGGVSGWMMRLVVHERGWVGETEFLSGLALCQVFPGINVLNLCIWLGYRLRGGAGAVAGGLAMIIPPALVLLALATAFAGVSEILSVRRALAGGAAGGGGAYRRHGAPGGKAQRGRGRSHARPAGHVRDGRLAALATHPGNGRGCPG